MQETSLRIRLLGDPALRRKAHPVSGVTAYHRQLLDAMLMLMRQYSGIGLAGPQVGIQESLIVADMGSSSGAYKLINPKVIKREGRQVLEEGCLSIPGVCIKVKRAQKIVVKALDENGKPLTLEAEELLACVIQHEIDHLRGVLIVDHASLFEKIRIRKRLEDLRKRAADEELSEPKTKSCQLQL